MSRQRLSLLGLMGWILFFALLGIISAMGKRCEYLVKTPRGTLVLAHEVSLSSILEGEAGKSVVMLRVERDGLWRAVGWFVDKDGKVRGETKQVAGGMLSQEQVEELGWLLERENFKGLPPVLGKQERSSEHLLRITVGVKSVDCWIPLDRQEERSEEAQRTRAGKVAGYIASVYK